MAILYERRAALVVVVGVGRGGRRVCAKRAGGKFNMYIYGQKLILYNVI